MKPSQKMDIAFFIIVGIMIYFALLLEYNIDLLDYVRLGGPAPKQLHPAERMRKRF